MLLHYYAIKNEYQLFSFQMGTMMRSSMVSLNSQVDMDLKQVFTQVGYYKKSIIAIKKVNKKYVDLTRQVRKELKMVKFLCSLLFIVFK